MTHVNYQVSSSTWFAVFCLLVAHLIHSRAEASMYVLVLSMPKWFSSVVGSVVSIYNPWKCRLASVSRPICMHQ